MLMKRRILALILMVLAAELALAVPVLALNLFAKRLHLTQTHYINPDGLTYLTPQGRPDPNQYSSAADVAHLTRFAMANPFFAQLVELQHYVLPASAVHHAYTWDSINTLLSTY